ncbi:MAG TPA: hypothetical protein VGR21_04670, partial [Cryptosporangiaceae bacterium]|nr:hypothetical protein [Cryptosporangiaceae bacterium]
MTTRRKPGQVLAAKVSWAVLAAVVALVLALHGAGIWTLGTEWQARLIVATAVISVGTTLLAALGEYRRQRGEALAQHARAILVPLAFVLQDLTGIDVRDQGIAAYLRRRLWWSPFRERLVRIYRERPRLSSASGVDWRPGVGVIGRCVALGQDVCVDVASLDELLAGVTEGEWAGLDAEITLGLSYADHQRLRG